MTMHCDSEVWSVLLYTVASTVLLPADICEYNDVFDFLTCNSFAFNALPYAPFSMNVHWCIQRTFGDAHVQFLPRVENCTASAEILLADACCQTELFCYVCLFIDNVSNVMFVNFITINQIRSSGHLRRELYWMAEFYASVICNWVCALPELIERDLMSTTSC